MGSGYIDSNTNRMNVTSTEKTIIETKDKEKIHDSRQ